MMDEVRLRALRENHQKLRTKLIVVNVLPELRSYFTEVEYLQVESKSDNIAQVDELLRVLETKENGHFDGFCRVLERNGYRHWAQQLRATAGGNKETTEDLDRELMVEKECLYYVDIEELDDAFYGVLLRSIDKFVLESTDASFQCFRREAERVIRHRGHVTNSKVRLSRVRTEFLDEIQDKYALWDSNLEYRSLREVIMRCEDEGLMKQLQQYEDLLRKKSKTIIYNCKKQKQMSSGLYMKLKAKHETTLATLMRVQDFLVKEVGLDDAIFTGFREGCIELYFKLSPETASISMGPLLSGISQSKLLLLGVSNVELSGHWVIDTASGRVTYLKCPQNERLTEGSDNNLSADEATQHASDHIEEVTQESNFKQFLLPVPSLPLVTQPPAPPTTLVVHNQARTGSRKRKPVSSAEFIHAYVAPLQCSLRPRLTHLKSNLMVYSNHTLPSPVPLPQVQQADNLQHMHTRSQHSGDEEKVAGEKVDGEQADGDQASLKDESGPVTEGTDCPSFNLPTSCSPIPGGSAPFSVAAPQPSDSLQRQFFIRLPPRSKMSGRERRPASQAESIHAYVAPLQSSLRPRPTHLKCNLMVYSDHTLPSPPVVPQQPAKPVPVVVHYQPGTGANVDRLWPCTPPTWSVPGCHLNTPQARQAKVSPLALQSQSSVCAEDRSFYVEYTPLSQNQDLRIQNNAVAMVTQFPHSPAPRSHLRAHHNCN